MGQNDDTIIELRETVTARTSGEIKQDTFGARRPHYRPGTDQLKRLDRSINRKFDVFVVFVLAVDFILQGIDKNNAKQAADTSCEYKSRRNVLTVEQRS